MSVAGVPEVRWVGHGWLQEGAAFPGVVGGTYRLSRYNGRVELYFCGEDGREAFVGYLPARVWGLRVVCPKCGAPAGQPCRATGMCLAPGTPMGSVHAARGGLS